MKNQFLHLPVQQLSDVKLVFGGTGNLVYPTKLACLFAGLAKDSEDVAVEVQFVYAARHRIRRVQHLSRTARDAKRPGRADCSNFFNEGSVGIKDLNTIVCAVAHAVQGAGRARWRSSRAAAV